MPITIDYNINWHLEQFSFWNLSILYCLNIQKAMDEVQKYNGAKCDAPLSDPMYY
jgi:hypothetical protein